MRPVKPGRFVAKLLLLLYGAGVVAFTWHRAGEDLIGDVRLWDLQSDHGPLLVAKGILLGILADTAAAFPIGCIAAYATRLRGWWWGQIALVTIAVTILVAGIAYGIRTGTGWRWIGPTELAVPVFAALTGAWIAVHVRRGRKARQWLMVKLAVLMIVLVGGSLGLLSAAVEEAPLPFAPAAVTSREKVAIAERMKAASPLKMAPGQTKTLELSEHDLDVLMAWGLKIGNADRKAIVILDGGVAEVSGSARLPLGGDRYLNAVMRVRLEEHSGLRVRMERLRLGDLEIPGPLLRLLSPLVELGLRQHRATRPLMLAVEDVSIDKGRLSVTYGPVKLPKGLREDLFGTDARVMAAARVQAEHLLDRLPASPSGDKRFVDLVSAAFALARERSMEGDPVVENRGAILALGTLLGHTRVQQFYGTIVERPVDVPTRSAFYFVTLRGRPDWTKHFWVSAAITLLSTDATSNAAGLLKEELDAGRGGSGFSFADLCADRAGTTFALTATRDAESARAMQERLADGFEVAEVFPEAADLPENLSDLKFEQQFGGVGGKKYQEQVDEIERRIADCAAYR